MKITVEINDETLKNAIGQQLERVVSEQVRAQIDAVVDGVLNKKLERFDNDAISNRVTAAAKAMIEQTIGRDDWSRSAHVKAAVERAAVAVVKERMK
jgi:hypothetical protein